MSRQNKKEMFYLEPVITNTKIKIDKVTISHEKSGSSKVRFTHGSKPYSHGVGRLDNNLYRDKVISICKSIAIDLRLGKFNPDHWKKTYFGIDKDSQVIDFPKSQPSIVTSRPIIRELTLIDIWENYLSVKGNSLSYNSLNGSVKATSQRIDYAKNTDSSSIYLDNIDNFISILKSKYADNTLMASYRLFNSAFNLALKQGKINGNPFTI